ncbi:hypothetical protein FKM82_011877 [Ascaphus truei]
MVQEFQVLRCSSCHTFQVQQVKKSKKWNCKLCGEKQSLIKIYGQGSGADCRHHVQKLNLLRGEVQQAADCAARQQESSDEESNEDIQERTLVLSEIAAPVSRWNKYTENNSDESSVKEEREKEEEESLVCTDEQLYSHQNKATAEHRKRKKVLLGDCGFDGQDCNNFRERSSKGATRTAKRARACEDWKVCAYEEKLGLQVPQCSEPMGTDSPKFHGKKLQPMAPVSEHPRCAESTWGRFISSPTAVEPCGESISIPLSQRKTEPSRLDITWSKKAHDQEAHEMGQVFQSVSSGKSQGLSSLTSREVAAFSKCFATTAACIQQKEMPIEWKTQNDKQTDLYLTGHPKDHVLGSNITTLSTTLPKTLAPSIFFQTDEDFDDNF